MCLCKRRCTDTRSVRLLLSLFRHNVGLFLHLPLSGTESEEETVILLSSVSLGGRPLCTLRFTDDIDLLGGSEEELQQITKRMETR